MASLSRSGRRFAIVVTSLIVRSENLIVCPPIRHGCDQSACLFESAGRLATSDAMSRPTPTNEA
jgi:hypothetical protein